MIQVIWDGTADRIGGKYLALSYQPAVPAKTVLTARGTTIQGLRARVIATLQKQPMTSRELVEMMSDVEPGRVFRVIGRLKAHGALVVTGSQTKIKPEYGRRVEAIYAVAR